MHVTWESTIVWPVWKEKKKNQLGKIMLIGRTISLRGERKKKKKVSRTAAYILLMLFDFFWSVVDHITGNLGTWFRARVHASVTNYYYYYYFWGAFCLCWIARWKRNWVPCRSGPIQINRSTCQMCISYVVEPSGCDRKTRNQKFTRPENPWILLLNFIEKWWILKCGLVRMSTFSFIAFLSKLNGGN